MQGKDTTRSVGDSLGKSFVTFSSQVGMALGGMTGKPIERPYESWPSVQVKEVTLILPPSYVHQTIKNAHALDSKQFLGSFLVSKPMKM